MALQTVRACESSQRETNRKRGSEESSGAREGGAGGQAARGRGGRGGGRGGSRNAGRAAEGSGQRGPPWQAGRGLRLRSAHRGCGPRKGRECAPPRAEGRSPATARLSFKSPSLPPFASPTRSGPGPPRLLFPPSPWVSETSPSPWGASTLRCEGRWHPLPQLPRVESLAFPSVPATLRHYRQPRSSTRRPGVSNWSEESSIPRT